MSPELSDTPDLHDKPNRAAVMTRALKAIDRSRRVAFLTFLLGWLATLASLVWFTYVLHHSTDIRDALAVAVIALVFAICMSSFVVAVIVTRMTQTVLRAIHLTTAAPQGPRT